MCCRATDRPPPCHSYSDVPPLMVSFLHVCAETPLSLCFTWYRLRHHNSSPLLGIGAGGAEQIRFTSSDYAALARVVQGWQRKFACAARLGTKKEAWMLYAAAG